MNTLARISPISSFTRWNPLRELEEMQKRMSSLMDLAPNGDGERESLTVAECSPAVDVSEDEKEFLLKVELPEMKKEDVKVTVEHGTLQICGERKAEKEEKNRKFHRIERCYGSFLRAFTMPEGTDGTRVQAEYRDGVLSVHLPKTQEAKQRAKSIEVKVA